jgi:hypothetical protein
MTINQRSLILHALATSTSVILSGPEFATVEPGSTVVKALDVLCHPEPELCFAKIQSACILNSFGLAVGVGANWLLTVKT